MPELNPNRMNSKETTEKETLEFFEIEQLIFLNNQASNLSDFLFKLRQRDLKYSELENVIKKLSHQLIKPHQYQNFKLIHSGPHFTMYIPNTRELWEKVTDGYQLIPRKMTTLNGWKGQYGQHHLDVLSPWAVERCEEAFKRAGITAERLQQALRSKQNGLKQSM